MIASGRMIASGTTELPPALYWLRFAPSTMWSSASRPATRCIPTHMK